MTQEELLKALKGGSTRKETNLDLGQVQLRPTIQRGGQYNVQVQQAPQTNPALQLADALKDSSKLLNNFVDIQTKQGEIEANALTPEEVIRRVEQGDPNAGSFLDKLGKEKTFVETTYKRYYNSTVQPKLTALAEELKNRPVHEYADQGITTPEDFKVYADGRVKELTDQFSEYTDKSPYAKVLHNQLIEEVVPDLVQRQVSNFDSNVTKFNKDEVINNLTPLTADHGVNPAPTAAKNVPATGGSRITQFGQTGKDGGVKDSLLDSNSAIGIGFRVPPAEQAKIKKGLPSIHKMKAGDVAVSPDIREQLEAQGVKYMDTITLKLEDGTTHTGRWMSVTAEEFQGKPMSGRWDLYTPEGNNPLDGKKVSGWSTDEATAAQRFNGNVNNVFQVNADALLNRAKVSPTEASKILRENASTEIQTLTKEGKFAEARKLLGAINDVKLGNQPLFGSVDGRATFVGLEDLVDREEDQFSAENERTSRTKVDNIVSPVLIDIRKQMAQGGDLDDLYKKASDSIFQNSSLTPTEQEQALRSIDTLVSNKSAAEFTRASNGDKAVNKALEEGGSQLVFRNIANVGTVGGAEAFIANDPELQNSVLQTSADGMKKIINPAFGVVVDGVLGRLIPQYSSEMNDKTERILTGTSFDYDVNGKVVRFEGTQDKKEQAILHLKLAQLLKEDMGAAVSAGIKSDIQKNPVFAAPVTAVESTRAQLIRQEEEKLVAVGMNPEEAKKAVLQQSIAESKGNTLLDSNGKPRKSKNLFESDSTYVARYISDVSAGLLVDPKEHAELYNTVKFEGNKVAQSLVVDAFKSRTPAEKLKSYGAINEHFKNIGIPWDAVQKGFIEADFIGRYTPKGARDKRLYSLDSLFSSSNSESTFQIIPLNIMQNLDNPKAKAAVQKIADDRYGGDYNRLVKGQENWYSSKKISLTK
jgi:hypothetical protein